MHLFYSIPNSKYLTEKVLLESRNYDIKSQISSSLSRLISGPRRFGIRRRVVADVGSEKSFPFNLSQ